MNSLHSWFRQRFFVGKSQDSVAQSLKEVVEKKGYKFFEDGEYNLNIIGIRNSEDRVNQFDDLLVLAFKANGNLWQIMTMDCTTDPGLYYMRNTLSPLGVADLVPNQYRGSHQIGLHNGKYEALIQTGGPLKVYRDNNKDEKLDRDISKIETGFFGINIHRAWDGGIAQTVENFSAGCTVVQDIQDFNRFMEVCRMSRDIWGNSFSYTLLESSDFA